MTTATPTKLRDGSWGVRVPGKPDNGEVVLVKTKSGKSWNARIVSVIWTGDNKYGDGSVSICKTESVETRQSRPARRRSKWCECGACEDLLSIGYRPGQKVRCPECGGMAEAC